MRRVLVLVVASAAAAGFLLDRRAHSSADDDSGEREVRALEEQLARAVVAGDRAFFDRAFAPDFTHTSHSGAFKTRAEWFAESKSNGQGQRPATTRYDELPVDDLAVRVYGDTAVVTGRTTPKGQTAKGQPMTGRYRFLRVWVKRQGQWQAVAFQGTRIADS